MISGNKEIYNWLKSAFLMCLMVLFFISTPTFSNILSSEFLDSKKAVDVEKTTDLEENDAESEDKPESEKEMEESEFSDYYFNFNSHYKKSFRTEIGAKINQDFPLLFSNYFDKIPTPPPEKFLL